MQTLKYIKLVILIPLLIMVFYFLFIFFQSSQINPDIKQVKKISLNEQTANKKTNTVSSSQDNVRQKLSSSFSY